MTDYEIIAEIQNMRKYNYTLADDEVFDRAIQGIKALTQIEDAIAEIEQIELSGYVENKTMFMRTAEQVKNMALKIIKEHMGVSE